MSLFLNNVKKYKLLKSHKVYDVFVFTVGINCHFDPFVSLDAMRLMRDALEAERLLERPTYLMCQPLAYFTPDAGKQGFIDLPEFPFGLVKARKF